MKKVLLLSAVLAFSAFAHAISPGQKIYGCQGSESTLRSHITIKFTNDPNKIELLSFQSTGGLTLNKSAEQDGSVTYSGAIGCVPTANNPRPICHAIGRVDVTVSPELERGDVRGTAQLWGQTYSCSINFTLAPQRESL